MISLALVVFDIFAINLSYLFALWFRFDCRASMIPMHYLDGWLRSAPAFTIVTIILFCGDAALQQPVAVRRQQ